MVIFEMMLLSSIVVFVAGALIAGQLNRGIYRLAYDKRMIGPWSAADEKAPPRKWYDRIPVFGWLTLRRESTIHGGAFWVRPMIIELSVGIGFAALYWAETSGALLPSAFAANADGLQTILHSQYLAHIILISLMIMATFIDFDEQTIPDSITVPGTLVGLLLMWALPTGQLIIPISGDQGAPAILDFLHVGSPAAFPVWMDSAQGLGLALSIFLFWCFAILDRHWITRSGFKRAIDLFVYGIRRNPNSLQVAWIAALGSLAIVAAWGMGGPQWRSLMSSLCGLAGGAGVVWAIRLVGTKAMNQEAMGFGDVTLMAMVGSFLGWQPATLAFFLAPFAGVFIAIGQALVLRKMDLAYGPYLCVASLGLILTWGRLWPEWAIDIYRLGPLLVAIFFALLLLMFVMLYAMQLVKRLFAH